MWAVSHVGPSLDLPLKLRAVAFIVTALAGAATAFAGQAQFRRANTTINPFKPQNTSALVTSGVYRLTRNPMYVGLVLVVLGWAAFLCSLWALAGPILFVLYISRFQIKPEEQILSAKFGASYAEYQSRVHRWL
jgi:protein-S-isoprenylcysteine O-methyltransferase Ste14